MALRSSLDDMGGRFLSTVGAKFPQVNILRPLLEVRKADLQEACQNEGVKWTEEQLHSNVRKHIRKIVQENEELVPGIAGLIKTCQETRRHLKAQGIVASTKFHRGKFSAACTFVVQKYFVEFAYIFANNKVIVICILGKKKLNCSVGKITET